MNKYEYLWVVQGNYGQGWEDLTCGNYREARDNLKDHRLNEVGIPFRKIQRRILNTQLMGV